MFLTIKGSHCKTEGVMVLHNACYELLHRLCNFVQFVPKNHTCSHLFIYYCIYLKIFY